MVSDIMNAHTDLQQSCSITFNLTSDHTFYECLHNIILLSLSLSVCACVRMSGRSLEGNWPQCKNSVSLQSRSLTLHLMAHWYGHQQLCVQTKPGPNVVSDTCRTKRRSTNILGVTSGCPKVPKVMKNQHLGSKLSKMVCLVEVGNSVLGIFCLEFL